MYKEILENIGLTKGEIKVYLTLLKVGETTTGKIIEKSGVSSGKTYEILDKLQQKGLVTHIVKEKTKYFQATSPKKLLEYVDEKKSQIEKKKKDVENILPQLISLHKLEKKEYSAVIYKGIQGLRTALYETLDSLNKNNEWLAFGVREDRPKNILIVWDQWLNARVKREIHSKMIVANKEAFHRFKKIKHTDFRLLNLKSTAPMTISGDVVIIYNWKELSLIKITNKEIAESMREFFYGLWEVGKKL